MNIRRAILIYLAGERRWPTSSADLSGELHASWKAVRYELRKMKDDGLVAVTVEGANDIWHLTTEGREAASQ